MTRSGYGKGWFFESKRHALAAKGIMTKKISNLFSMQYPINRHEVQEDKVKFNRWGYLKVLSSKILHDTDGDGVPDRDDCSPFNPKAQDGAKRDFATIRVVSGLDEDDEDYYDKEDEAMDYDYPEAMRARFYKWLRDHNVKRWELNGNIISLEAPEETIEAFKKYVHQSSKKPIDIDWEYWYESD